MVMFWDRSDSIVFGVFSGNQCHRQIRRQVLHETLFLSQIFQILTMVILYMSPTFTKEL